MDENKLLIRVHDDGPGFASKDLPKIFERFYKGEKGNMGLGLAISKNVIEGHKGKITATNHDSGGALFIIELTT
jgi:signal transduction histidine kinase